MRVLPLVVQGSGAAVPFLPDLLAALRARGHQAGSRPVDHEFQRGADRVLVVRRG